MKTEFYESEIVARNPELFPAKDEPKEITREKWLLDGDMSLFYSRGKMAISAETAEQEAKDPTEPDENPDHPRGKKQKKANVLELPPGGNPLPPAKHQRRDN
jgi:hypothetical protein